MKRTRKFSIDLPRLKIGSLKPSKQDHPVLEPQTSRTYLDSPPQTPRSVRPPLPIQVDADLRAACTSVVTDYRPSHKSFAPAPPNVPKQQLDYAAVKARAQRDDHISHLALRQRAITTDVSYMPRQDHSRHRRTSVLNDVVRVYDDSTYSHVKHRVSTLPADALAQNPSELERPRLFRRTESGETNGSTPHTDNTDYPWSDKASTAMTSAVVTPAHNSHRGSGQAQPTAEDVSASTNETLRMCWADRDKVQGQKYTVKSPSGDTHARAALVPARKPVPSHLSAAAGSVRETNQSGRTFDNASRPSSSRRDFSSQQDSSPTSCNATCDMSQCARPESRQAYAAGEEHHSRRRSRSITRQVKDYFRSASHGRGSSIVDNLRSHSRSDSRQQSRAQSQDRKDGDGDRSLHRSSSRSRWRSVTSLHRLGRSTDSLDLDRPQSSDSNNRGRRDPNDAVARPKPAIDLNRALPPLPGLDQWKDSDETWEARPVSSVKRVDPLRCNPPGTQPELVRRPSNRRLSKSYNDMPTYRTRAQSIDDQGEQYPEQLQTSTQRISGSDNKLARRSMSVSIPAANATPVFELEGSTPLSLDPASPSRSSRRPENVPIGRPIEKRRAFLRTESDSRNSREFGGGLRQPKRTTVDALDGPLPARYQASALKTDISPASPPCLTIHIDDLALWSPDAVAESPKSSSVLHL